MCLFFLLYLLCECLVMKMPCLSRLKAKWPSLVSPLLLLAPLWMADAYAASAPNLLADIPGLNTAYASNGAIADFWGGKYGVKDIEAVFNNARRKEEQQLGLAAKKLKSLVMPSQAVWDGMSDDAKALFLINDERKARAGAYSGVIGLPYAGIDSRIDAVARDYAYVLIGKNATGHYQPSGNSSTDNPDKRINAKVKAECKEFLARSENLAYYWAGNTLDVLDEKSIRLPLERAIYEWIYVDASSAWGHREAALLQDESLAEPGKGYGFSNNNGSSLHEGFLGIHKVGSTKYRHPSFTPDVKYAYGVVVVMNFFDPLGSSSSLPSTCKYETTLKTEELLPTTAIANRKPKLSPDAVTATSGKALVMTTLLDNDSDPDGNLLSIVGNTKPTNGTVVRTGNTLTYTSKAGFKGLDKFNYTVSDGKGGKASAKVTVTVK